MSAKKAGVKLLITELALQDIASIEEYSIAQWGKRVAAKYICDIEAALVRVQEKSQLLRPAEGFHAALSFYRVNKHLLVCDVRPTAIVLLTVIHASRDIPGRLAELVPTLAAEVEMLHEQLDRKAPP